VTTIYFPSCFAVVTASNIAEDVELLRKFFA